MEVSYEKHKPTESDDGGSAYLDFYNNQSYHL